MLQAHQRCCSHRHHLEQAPVTDPRCSEDPCSPLVVWHSPPSASAVSVARIVDHDICDDRDNHALIPFTLLILSNRPKLAHIRHRTRSSARGRSPPVSRYTRAKRTFELWRTDPQTRPARRCGNARPGTTLSISFTDRSDCRQRPNPDRSAAEFTRCGKIPPGWEDPVFPGSVDVESQQPSVAGREPAVASGPHRAAWKRVRSRITGSVVREPKRDHVIRRRSESSHWHRLEEQQVCRPPSSANVSLVGLFEVIRKAACASLDRKNLPLGFIGRRRECPHRCFGWSACEYNPSRQFPVGSVPRAASAACPARCYLDRGDRSLKCHHLLMNCIVS